MDSEHLSAYARGLIASYRAKYWQEDTTNATVLGIEEVLKSPLYNPDTRRKSRTFQILGVADKLIERSGEAGIIVLEHKTTSEKLDDPGSPFWRRLQFDTQGLLYEVLCLQNAIPLNRVIWDVIRKPAIRPLKKLHAQDMADIKDGYYRGCELTSQQQEQAIAAGGMEAPALFGLRVQAMTSAVSEHWFLRRSIMHTDADRIAFMRDLWAVKDEILSSRNHRRWPKNPEACMAYRRPCEFLGVCSGYDTIDSDRWQPRVRPHGAKPGATLTKSAIGTYLTCRQKYHNRYEIGVERADADRSEALDIGSAVHLELDLYWRAIATTKRKENK